MPSARNGKRQHIGARGAARAAIGAALSASLALAGAAPALADTSGGETALYVTLDQTHLTTPEGYGDDQMRVTIPVAISYVADELGNLTGPADGATLISNNATAGAVHVSQIHAVPESGISLVTTAAAADEDDEVFLSVTPGAGTADTFGNYVEAKAPTAGQWDVAQGSSLALNNLGGKVGGLDTIDPSTKARIATIEWTVAAGTAAQAEAESNRFVIHQVTPDAGTIDLVTTKTGSAAELASGYTWHLGSSGGTTVSSVAGAIAAAGANASEVYLYGVAV